MPPYRSNLTARDLFVVSIIVALSFMKQLLFHDGDCCSNPEIGGGGADADFYLIFFDHEAMSGDVPISQAFHRKRKLHGSGFLWLKGNAPETFQLFQRAFPFRSCMGNV